MRNRIINSTRAKITGGQPLYEEESSEVAPDQFLPHSMAGAYTLASNPS